MVGFVAFCFVILSIAFLAYSIHKLRKREQELLIEKKAKSLSSTHAATSTAALRADINTGAAYQSEQQKAAQLVHNTLNAVLTQFAYVTAESAELSNSRRSASNKHCPKCGANWDGTYNFCLHCSYTAA